MGESRAVTFSILDPQYRVPTESRDVTLLLDHLQDRGPGNGLEELYAEETKKLSGGKVTFSIRNAISSEEMGLFNFCKDQMKRKNFEAIVSRSSELLKNHPSSLWAHFFYGVACKKIPDKERFFVPALATAVSINPNFLSGWQALHKHYLSLGGLFSKDSHYEMCVVVQVLLKLDTNYENWCTLVGHIWDYVVSCDVNQYRMLSLLEPYLNCSCRRRKVTVATFFINFIRVKNKLLPKEFSTPVMLSFQALITQKESEVYRLGILYAALRYFNRTNDPIQVCHLLNFIHVNDVLRWNLKTAKEFAYNLIHEIFRTLGEDALEAVVILRNACGQDMLNNDHYFLCNAVFKLTNSHHSLLENHNIKQITLRAWGRLMYLKVLIKLKLFQEAYEQILVDLSCGVGNVIAEKAYMEMLIDIFSHIKDPSLLLFTQKLCYKYLKLYGLKVRVLYCLCLVSLTLEDLELAREILKRLVSLGALNDVIYLQALLEEDDDAKLDYLKSLENVPEAHLLSASVYRDLGKSKRVLKSMLEASFYFHGGISPFEWLGIHYYERGLVVKATRYFLEAFSNYLVSCISVNYIVAIYSKHGDLSKTRAFFDTLGSRSAITVDVACTTNLKAGLNYMTKAKETLDFHRALEKFRKVTDISFERKTIELVADSLGYFGMHGSAADFYLMCHAEHNAVHVYPSVLYGAETKMIRGKGSRYMSIARNVARKARKSPLALHTVGCAVFDRAVSSYAVNNLHHSIFLCQQAVLMLSRCIALYSEVATFWISLGNVLFAVSSMHSSFAAVYVPTWLLAQNGQSQTMVLVNKHEAFILALRCYSVAMTLSKSVEMKQLVSFYVGLTLRYAKTFYKEVGDRMLCWSLSYALDSYDANCWQRNNLCGVTLTGLGEYRAALECFKDAMLIGAREDARDAEFNLGIIYLRLGEFTNAHEVFMHRRGNDPMDSLVWRSYMLLHHCLGDRATVLHYLWYLIYSIRHYPSLEQGMEYLRLIYKSGSITSTDLDHLKKKCLLYTIFLNPMFMKMTFVGDCEIPHRFNDVTAANYFFHGKFQAALGQHSAAEENFHEFLKLVAEHGHDTQHHIAQSLIMSILLSGSDGSNTSAATSEALSGIDQSKFYTLEALNGASATSQLIAELPRQSSNCDQVFDSLRNIFKPDSPLSPSSRKLHAAFVSKTLVSQLLGIRENSCSPSPCFEDSLEDVINDIFDQGVSGKTNGLLSWSTYKNLLEEEISNFKLKC